jgi:hypothetical protein
MEKKGVEKTRSPWEISFDKLPKKGSSIEENHSPSSTIEEIKTENPSEIWAENLRRKAAGVTEVEKKNEHILGIADILGSKEATDFFRKKEQTQKSSAEENSDITKEATQTESASEVWAESLRRKAMGVSAEKKSTVDMELEEETAGPKILADLKKNVEKFKNEKGGKIDMELENMNADEVIAEAKGKVRQEKIKKIREAAAQVQKIIDECKDRREANLKRLAELDKEESEKKENKEDIESFPADFIKEKILSILQKEKVTIVKNPEIKGAGNEISIDTTIKSWGGTIGIQITLESKDGLFTVKSHKIDAGWPYKGKVEEKLLPNLIKISKLLIDNIEQEKNKKVEKIWIENGQLKALYKK